MAKLPAIIGEQPKAVKDRPKCKYCGRALRAQIRFEWENLRSATAAKRTFNGMYGHYNLFCSRSHAEAWGIWVAREIFEGRQRLVKNNRNTKAGG